MCVCCSCVNFKQQLSHPLIITRINLLGRRVIMSADVFGGKEDECYHGIVVRKSKYRQNDKTKHGHAVKWHIGDVDFW